MGPQQKGCLKLYSRIIPERYQAIKQRSKSNRQDNNIKKETQMTGQHEPL